MPNIIEIVKNKIEQERQKHLLRLEFPEGTRIRESVDAEYRPTKANEEFLVRRADWIDGTTTGQMANGEIFKAFDDPSGCSPMFRGRKS